MISAQRAILIILVVAVCTFATRVLPFLFFGGNRGVPRAVNYLGKILPPAIMATLVIYCLKGISLLRAPHGAPGRCSCGHPSRLETEQPFKHRPGHRFLYVSDSGRIRLILCLRKVYSPMESVRIINRTEEGISSPEPEKELYSSA